MRPRKERHGMSKTQKRPAVRAMYVGLLLALVASVAPYIDRATGQALAHHIRSGYPGYSHLRVDTAVTTWVVILTVVGVLGIVSWVWVGSAYSRVSQDWRAARRCGGVLD
jgi:hypothetical protein